MCGKSVPEEISKVKEDEGVPTACMSVATKCETDCFQYTKVLKGDYSLVEI